MSPVNIEVRDEKDMPLTQFVLKEGDAFFSYHLSAPIGREKLLTVFPDGRFHQSTRTNLLGLKGRWQTEGSRHLGRQPETLKTLQKGRLTLTNL